MTVGFAIIFAFFIPNKPANMRWVNLQERERLMYRLEVDRGTQDATEEISTRHAFVMALTDVSATNPSFPVATLLQSLTEQKKVWLLAFTIWTNWIAAAVTNFFAVVVQSLGFNRTTTLAITAPPYILCIIVIVLVGWHSDKTNERTWHIVASMSVCILANIIALATLNTGARYFAMMIMPGSFYGATIVLLSWISSCITGPAVTRAIAIAMINSFGNSANIWTSYLYRPPRYVLAFSVNLGASIVCILLVLCINRYLRHLNARLDRGEDIGKHGPTLVQKEANYRFAL